MVAGDPVERRAIEFQMVPRASQSLRGTAHHWAGLASAQDAKYAHISAEDKQKVRWVHTVAADITQHMSAILLLACSGHA